MEELLKVSFLTYVSLAIFTGFWIVAVTFGLVKKTKKIENQKIKTVLRIVIFSALACFWTYFFVYLNLYPVSFAYYEYNNNLVEEAIGVIDSIEYAGKDRIYISIDNTDYTMVYSSTKPINGIGKDIIEGDMVQIQFGEQSMYIFNICKLS